MLRSHTYHSCFQPTQFEFVRIGPAGPSARACTVMRKYSCPKCMHTAFIVVSFVVCVYCYCLSFFYLNATCFRSISPSIGKKESQPRTTLTRAQMAHGTRSFRFDIRTRSRTEYKTTTTTHSNNKLNHLEMPQNPAHILDDYLWCGVVSLAGE